MTYLLRLCVKSATFLESSGRKDSIAAGSNEFTGS